MNFTIEGLQALEVLDSRGRPTVRAFCDVGGQRVWATAPSGASTGSHEAWERRDGNPDRYGGLGCLDAVAAVNGEIADSVVGHNFADHRELDLLLADLDGTTNLGRLGANATLATSLAAALAVARAEGIELYEYFASLAATSTSLTPEPALPRPMVNLFSGGRHAGAGSSTSPAAIQDLLVVSMADELPTQLEQIERVYAAAVDVVRVRYRLRELTADEGGLAPDFAQCGDMFADAARAVEQAGLSLGDDIRFAVDVAASEFFDGAAYAIDGDHVSESELTAVIATWCDQYPIVSIEDGLAEDAWSGWNHLRAALPVDTVVIGDDLLCTNAERVERAVTLGAANGLLLKVNQAGTLSLALEALGVARAADWSVTVSARSGETEDRWLADAATGWGGDFIKVGSVRQSERLAKYNRLLELAAGLATFP